MSFLLSILLPFFVERYTHQQRVQIVQLYYENQRSVKDVFRKLRPTYGPHNRPSESTICKITEKFKGAATCWDVPSSGRPCTARSVENIAALTESVAEDRDNTLPSTANIIAPY
uniref:Putative LOC100572414 [Acyrthosiphon pisum] n=1 Tax=Lepeophtheirus salmonis TaxID=72036 RepID=A0A0K2UYB6_LEPSM